MPNVLSIGQACVKTSLSRASIYRKLDATQPEYYDPTFPKPFPLSDRKVNTKGKRAGELQQWNRWGFLEDELDSWIMGRVKKRDP